MTKDAKSMAIINKSQNLNILFKIIVVSLRNKDK